MKGGRGTVTKLRQWAKRARTRVHRQEIRHELLTLLASRYAHASPDKAMMLLPHSLCLSTTSFRSYAS